MWIVEIFDGKKRTYFSREELYRNGFRFHKSSKRWVLKTDNLSSLEEYRKYANDHHFRFIYYPEGYRRSFNYRNEFFRNREPDFKDMYFCAYCGSLLKKEDVTVDHIIPIKRAKANRLAKRLLEKMNIQDINDLRNLAPCCYECNSRKGKKLGLWVIRGFIGKNPIFWKIFYSSLFIWTIFLIFMITEVIA